MPGAMNKTPRVSPAQMFIPGVLPTLRQGGTEFVPLVILSPALCFRGAGWHPARRLAIGADIAVGKDSERNPLHRLIQGSARLRVIPVEIREFRNAPDSTRRCLRFQSNRSPSL